VSSPVALTAAELEAIEDAWPWPDGSFGR